ncbi:hypothetical protein JOC86_002067 [Bacillus pakistanensis]|uniref:ATP synthase F0 subunit 8 n=1 Tax=Rossellomorea pakistanensis TaxID=992288 RepID=A0ABS2NCH8_9BACI|nr:hypothetical protein [Bacillus pakistanensis]MBM7585525.1 hypothetical protein [Bacillus pakistanensis]
MAIIEVFGWTITVILGIIFIWSLVIILKSKAMVKRTEEEVKSHDS